MTLTDRWFSVYTKELSVTTRSSVPSLECSRGPAVFATRRDIPLLSVLSDLPMCAGTVKWRVCYDTLR